MGGGWEGGALEASEEKVTSANALARAFFDFSSDAAARKSQGPRAWVRAKEMQTDVAPTSSAERSGSAQAEEKSTTPAAASDVEKATVLTLEERSSAASHLQAESLATHAVEDDETPKQGAGVAAAGDSATAWLKVPACPFLPELSCAGHATNDTRNIFSRKSSQGIVTGPRSCTFCSRTFVSQHALDIHLSRNMVGLHWPCMCFASLDGKSAEQECRAMYRKSVTAARNAGANPPPVSRDPVPPVERAERDVPAATSALDFCRDSILAISKLTQGQPSVALIQKDLNAILRKLEVNQYKSVLEVKDDVLKIWAQSLRSASPVQ